MLLLSRNLGGSLGDDAAAAESLQFVRTDTITAQSSFDLALPDSPFILLEFRGSFSVDGASLEALVTTDNFSTVKTGASDYTYVLHSYAGGSESTGGADGAKIVLADKIGNAAGEGMFGELRVLFANDAAVYTTGQTDPNFLDNGATAASARHVSGWVYRAAAAVNGLRLSVPSGTFTAKIDVYAIS